MERNVNWKSITIQPLYENTEQAADFVRKNLPEEFGSKVIHQIAIIFDEIYSNIVKYSKAENLELKVGMTEEFLYLVFEDDGIPYNPLENQEPDTGVPIGERGIGGLGLFMVKRMTEYMEYQYQNGKNQFIVGKKIV